MARAIVVKRYKNDRQYQHDAQAMSRKGYSVSSVTSENQRSGCLRFLLLGFLFPPKPQLIVTYALA